MRIRTSVLGALAGVAIALVVLAVLAVMLLGTAGANYKVLVAVWLWLLPVTGVFAGAGYVLGSTLESLLRAAMPSEKGGPDGDAR